MQEQDILQYASGIPVYCAFDKILEIDSVQPNPKNPNQHSEEQIALLAKIIGTQGWRAPITISTVFDTRARPDFSAMSQEELLEYVESFYDRVDESPASILYCDKPTRNTDHPTMKPTALIAKLIENSSERDWIIIDPFGGSGSTLVACEAEGRVARLIEIEPKFCDVIVKRYVQVTGKQDVMCLRHGMKIPVQETKLVKGSM